MFQAIYTALGYSLHGDDLRGDFARALALAEQWLAQASDEERPMALLWLARVRLLQGEPRLALAALDEAAPLCAGQAAAELMVLTYRLVHAYETYNTFPDGKAPNAVEISARWRGTPDLIEPDRRWNELIQQVSGEEQFEAWYLYRYLSNLKPVRYLLGELAQTGHAQALAEVLDPHRQQARQVAQQSLQARQMVLHTYAGLTEAQLLRDAGQGDAALNLLQEVTQGAGAAQDLAGEACGWLWQGDWLAAPGSTPLACNFRWETSNGATSALPVSQEAREFPRPAPAALTRAREAYAEARLRYQTLDSTRGLAACEQREGYLHFLAQEHEAAARTWKKAAEGFARAGDTRYQQVAQAQHILALIGQGQFDQARQAARQLGEAADRSGALARGIALGVLLSRYGRHLLLRAGQGEAALAAYAAAHELHRALGAETSAAQNLADQAEVLQALGDQPGAATWLNEALAGYQQALDTYPARFPGGRDLVSGLSARIGSLQSEAYILALQRLDTDAMEHYAKALAHTAQAFSPIDPQDQLAQTTAYALQLQAQYAQQQAALLVPLYRARHARKQGHAAKAKALLAQAREATGDNGQAQAIFLAEEEKYAEATEAYRQYWQQQRAENQTHEMLALIEAQSPGHHATEKALAEQRAHAEAFAMYVKLYAFAEARHHLTALEELAGQAWWQQDETPWVPLAEQAEMWEGLGDSSRSLEAYAQAIEELEKRRRGLSRDEWKSALAGGKGAQHLYFQAARTALRAGEAALGFARIEQGKARALLDLMASQAGALPLTSDPLLAQWRELSAQVALWRGMLGRQHNQPQPDPARIRQLQTQLVTTDAELAQVVRQLEAQHPAWRDLLNPDTQPLSPREVAAYLPAGTLLVEVALLENERLCWTIDRTGLKQALESAVDVEALSRQARALRHACERGEAYEALAEELGQALLGGLDLAGYEALLLVPYGDLHQLPFQVLPHGGRMLGERFRLRYLPAASLLAFLPERARKDPPQMLAIGDPAGDLPAAAEEAGYVASLWGGQALTGAAATEEAVRAQLPEATMVHFATHGRLSAEAPLQSALLLAEGEELSLYELMGLQLQAELVVLSACETGRGETTGGDEVLGLTRGLLAAGAQAAVVSLWPVDDRATSLFMGEFYRQLQVGIETDAALQAAGRYLRELPPEAAEAALETVRISRMVTFETDWEPAARADFRHPFFWAGFVLVSR